MSRQLHSEHFDICRMCLRHPETNRNINFLDLYKPLNGGKTLKEYLKDLFDIIVEPNDQKPRIICEICYLKIVKIKEKKEKAAEPRVIMRSLYSKKPSLGQGSASLNASFDAINYDQIMDKPEFLSNAFSNSKENSEFISSSNQIKKHKKLRKGIVCKKITYEDESNDPNEPRYCLCDRVAFGSMVACDNKKCSHEWFHFECVGITTKPHGKWYCPKCFVKLKRKI